jgi:hypothetical protein
VSGRDPVRVSDARASSNASAAAAAARALAVSRMQSSGDCGVPCACSAEASRGSATTADEKFGATRSAIARVGKGILGRVWRVSHCALSLGCITERVSRHTTRQRKHRKCRLAGSDVTAREHEPP